MNSIKTVDDNGGVIWRNQDGEYHREDGPAVEYKNGYKAWYINGEFHREDGPAVEFSNGDKYWFINGKWHREDGPALEYANGDKYWYINGKLHREDGPAVEYKNGYKAWYINGVEYSEEEFNEKMKNKSTRTDRPWIETSKGTSFYFDDIENSYIDIEIVAKSLASQNRYNGHGKEYYSIAEHSILVSYLVDEEYAYEGLMHDSAEAIIGDMVSPLKKLNPEFKKYEERIEKRFANVFCYNFPYNPQVKKADIALLSMEKNWLFPNSKKEWSIPENPYDGFPLERITDIHDARDRVGGYISENTMPKILPRRFLSPEKAEIAFLERFKELLSIHV